MKGKRKEGKRAKTARRLPAKIWDRLWAVVDDGPMDAAMDWIPQLFVSRQDAACWAEEYGGSIVRVRIAMRSTAR